eukprot:253499-Amphidinium_carterae.1
MTTCEVGIEHVQCNSQRLYLRLLLAQESRVAALAILAISCKVHVTQQTMESKCACECESVLRPLQASSQGCLRKCTKQSANSG